MNHLNEIRDGCISPFPPPPPPPIGSINIPAECLKISFATAINNFSSVAERPQHEISDWIKTENGCKNGLFTQWTNPNVSMNIRIPECRSRCAPTSFCQQRSPCSSYESPSHIFAWIHGQISLCIVCKWYSSHNIVKMLRNLLFLLNPPVRQTVDSWMEENSFWQLQWNGHCPFHPTKYVFRLKTKRLKWPNGCQIHGINAKITNR